MMISRRIWREKRNLYICSLCNDGLRSIRFPTAVAHPRRWNSSWGKGVPPRPAGPNSSGWGSSPSFVPKAAPTPSSNGLSVQELEARRALLGGSVKAQIDSSSSNTGTDGTTDASGRTGSERAPIRNPWSSNQSQQAAQSAGSHDTPFPPFQKRNWDGPRFNPSNNASQAEGRSEDRPRRFDRGGSWDPFQALSPNSGARAQTAPRERVRPRYANDKTAESRESFYSLFGKPESELAAGRGDGRAGSDRAAWGNLPRRQRPREPQKERTGNSFDAFFGGKLLDKSDRRPERQAGDGPAWGNLARRQKPREPQTQPTGSSFDAFFEGKLLDKSDRRPERQARPPSSDSQSEWILPESKASAPSAPSFSSAPRSDRPRPSRSSEAAEAADTQPRRSQDSWGSRQPRAHSDDRYASRSKKATRVGGPARRRFDDDDADYDEEAEMLAEQRRRQMAQEKAERKRRRGEVQEEPQRGEIFLPEYISVTELAKALRVEVKQFLKALEEYGFDDVTEDSVFTGETAGLVAQEFGLKVKVDDGAARDLKPQPEPEDQSSLPQRPPIVAIMGHVDHGKTTLLDYLRKSSIAAQEHGGITQHIGAFIVNMSSGKSITFLDTPGHAAFLSMRQRGAEVTDIVILVVAADDSVKPQTLEALKHVRDAKVPMIVAITKADKADARIDQVKSDLGKHGVELEDFGGDVQVVCVSGKTGLGMDDLEENISTLSEILDVRADPGILAEGWVLEASVKPYGRAATVLVKRGTLRIGDYLVCGTAWARVRVLRNEAGQEVEEAPPGTPVEVLGWRDELPNAGDRALQPADEAAARSAVDYRREMQDREKTQQQIAETERQRKEAEAKAAAEEAASAEREDSEPAEEAEAEPGVTTVNFMVRADVVGSVEAVCATVQGIGNHEVKPRILRSAAGAITESDVEYAALSRSVIINFNIGVPGHIRSQAEDAGVRIIDRSVIYHVADDVKAELSAKLPDSISYKVLGEADIQQVFPINIKGRVYKNIAGCKIRNGTVKKTDKIRIMRKGKKIYDGTLESLKHGKKDVTEMKKGTECGMGCMDFQDLEVGDQIQAYEEVREKRTL